MKLRPLHDALRIAVSRSNIHELAAFANQLAGVGKPGTVLPSAALAAAETFGAPEMPQSAQPSTASEETDPGRRLRSIAETGRLFFERVLDSLPAESRAAIDAATPLRLASEVAPHRATAPEPNYADAAEKLLDAAAHLPLLAQGYSADWPARSRPVLPGSTRASRREHVWAPVLAYIVLRSIPARCCPRGDRTELFDRLRLRPALADLFAAMGMEGEAKWQAAAQVRVLLSHLAGQPDAARSRAFFADPDVRWLAGVNVSSGVTYFNKEQFEELLTWLQLPALLEIAAEPSAQIAGIAAIEASVAAAREAAQAAGYELDAYLAAAAPKPAKVFAASLP